MYLGERECSVQRRHQKVIEESPSPIMTPELRRAMGEAAVRLASEADYTNAGTVEFLVDAASNFYFLEVNTRLQVEHPVTEMVTGLDLVKLQIRIAAGEPLPFHAAGRSSLSGHAIECRLYAEDPANNFFPSPGTILSRRAPSGPGIRLDDGVYEGFTVPTEYDPMLGKLIAWGQDRAEAIARLERALEEYTRHRNQNKFGALLCAFSAIRNFFAAKSSPAGSMSGFRICWRTERNAGSATRRPKMRAILAALLHISLRAKDACPRQRDRGRNGIALEARSAARTSGSRKR